MAGTTALKLCIAVGLLFNGSVIAEQLFRSGSVYCKTTECVFKGNVLDKYKATAYGTFNDTLLVTGWGVLDIVSGEHFSSRFTNTEIMFAAGFIEGVFTAKHMEDNYQNLVASMGLGNSLLDKLRIWFKQQRAWTNMMIQKNSNDPFWRHVSYIIAQKNGLFAGYQSVRKHDKVALDMFAIDMLNGVGDVLDLRYVLEPSTFPDWMHMTQKEAELAFHKSGHCSALVKPVLENGNIQDIFMSHSSWFVYSATNRIYKHYYLNVNDKATSAKKLSFSSYAGFLESLDDFYLMDSGLVLLQTTNNVFNHSLYRQVTPQSLTAWQRVRVANMMAKTTREWPELLAKYNSGTYNNQYMVINFNGTPNENFLWVAEQIPGLVVADDLTHKLREERYFPSYNIPYFEEIYNLSGYPDMVKKYGAAYSYQMAPRARIFRRDQGKVKDMDSMKAIMRYNDYKHDPLSGGSPWGAICSRGDLDPTKPVAVGCYDTKVADLNMASLRQAEAISGPTLGTNLPVFSWTNASVGSPHIGLPNIYDFPFIRMQPRFHPVF